MKELNFITPWGDNREKSWSGTNISIFNALGKYFDINDYPVIPENKIKRKIKRLFNINDQFLSEIKLNSRHYNHLKGPVFQFSEILPTTPDRPTYIYNDLCVSFLYEMARNQPPCYKYSGFQILKTDSIRRRMENQDKYFHTASGIFTMGRWLADFMKDHYPGLSDRIHHVGAGINLDTEAIDGNYDRRGNKILFVGRDFERKGGHEVLKAFRNLLKTNPDLELHIAGPTDNPAPGQNNLFYHGDADHQQLHHLMNACDLFCMPSFFEAYGLVFIEALCFGLPCIGRDCFEMPYFIEEGVTGELIKTDDCEELEQKIVKILKNPLYHENVRSRRMSYIREYSWDTVAQRMAAVINH